MTKNGLLIVQLGRYEKNGNKFKLKIRLLQQIF